MTYDEVLRHLHGLLGEDVFLMISGAGQRPPELVAILRGSLLRGTSRSEDELIARSERITFDVGRSSFVLAREEFVSAELIDGDRDLLMIQLGDCDVAVCKPAATAA